MHALYAFHIQQEANYQSSLAEIGDAFKPDIFAKEPLSSQQLDSEKHKALRWFNDRVVAHGIVGLQPSPEASVNSVVGEKVWQNYNGVLTKDVHVLKNGLETALHDTLNAYLLILQLVVEWFTISKKQVQESELLEISTDVPKALANNHLLEALSMSKDFQQLLEERKLGWNEQLHIVVRWYNQFIKNAEKLRNVHTCKGKSRDNEVLNVILSKIIWRQEDIQQHFESLYLNWEEIKGIVKNLWTYVDSNHILEVLQQQESVPSANTFYKQLIDNTIANDSSLEELIQRYSKAWSLERLVLVDRIIIKLGLSEMHYLSDTPGKVVISEYVYLAKKYSTEKSLAFVNGILDAVAKEHNFVA